MDRYQPMHAQTSLMPVFLQPIILSPWYLKHWFFIIFFPYKQILALYTCGILEEKNQMMQPRLGRSKHWGGALSWPPSLFFDTPFIQENGDSPRI